MTGTCKVSFGIASSVSRSQTWKPCSFPEGLIDWRGRLGRSHGSHCLREGHRLGGVLFQIMIVEDNAVSAALLQECAEAEGFQVMGLFASGEGFLEVLGLESLPDLVLLDLGLPGMSGIEVAKQVKQRFPGIEIIIQRRIKIPVQFVKSADVIFLPSQRPFIARCCRTIG